MQFARKSCCSATTTYRLDWKVLVYLIAMLLALASQGHALCSCDGRFDQFFTGGFGITSITLDAGATTPVPLITSPDPGPPPGSGGSPLSTQCLTKSGAYVPIRTSVPAGNTNLSSYDVEIYLAPSSTYDPATQGPICCLDYSEDVKFVSTTVPAVVGQATGPALLQNGKFYIANGQLTTGEDTTQWKRLTRTCLKETDFHLVPGCDASHPCTNSNFIDSTSPNFSTGAPIQFGFFRANSTFAAGYNNVADIDNWSVCVNCPCTTPTHLKCYPISDSQSFTAIADLNAPQFGLEPGCKITGKAIEFCVPVCKDVVSAVDPKKNPLPLLPISGQALTGDQLCYKVSCKTSLAPAQLEVKDQFGQRTLKTKKAYKLCTPAKKPCGISGPQCGGFCPNSTDRCQDTAGVDGVLGTADDVCECMP